MAAPLLLMLARNAGPWGNVPPLVRLAGAGVLPAAVTMAARGWPALPLTRRRRAWWRWVGVPLSAALLLAPLVA
ncbi:Beta-lactamase [[Actinomadura] parvosata subsp. kistnae]|uniref:hypothetical protein n=1 Tax=[Actinomadura] parvosata TaxID=1955412 RepID=UPI000D29BA28|nr:Beta-lactamase [Actinomadura parvosata subsp. kistnae]